VLGVGAIAIAALRLAGVEGLRRHKVWSTLIGCARVATTTTERIRHASHPATIVLPALPLLPATRRKATASLAGSAIGLLGLKETGDDPPVDVGDIHGQAIDEVVVVGVRRDRDTSGHTGLVGVTGIKTRIPECPLAGLAATEDRVSIPVLVTRLLEVGGDQAYRALDHEGVQANAMPMEVLARLNECRQSAPASGPSG
jgi:hypothetical protein